MKKIFEIIKQCNPIINIATITFGVIAAYFMTIQSLKLELAEKAEERVVETLDKKLSNLEVILKEGVISKEVFLKFSNDMNNRLSRIEFYLTDKPGVKIEQK